MKNHLITLGVLVGIITAVAVMVWLMLITEGIFGFVLFFGIVLGLAYSFIYDSVKEWSKQKVDDAHWDAGKGHAGAKPGRCE